MASALSSALSALAHRHQLGASASASSASLKAHRRRRGGVMSVSSARHVGVISALGARRSSAALGAA